MHCAEGMYYRSLEQTLRVLRIQLPRMQSMACTYSQKKFPHQTPMAAVNTQDSNKVNIPRNKQHHRHQEYRKQQPIRFYSLSDIKLPIPR
jgi:hypothetical protein